MLYLILKILDFQGCEKYCNAKQNNILLKSEFPKHNKYRHLFCHILSNYLRKIHFFKYDLKQDNWGEFNKGTVYKGMDKI